MNTSELTHPVLTVGIPTYNRPEYLRNTLSIFAQCDPSQFKILICDDSTTDAVQDLVEDFFTCLPNLRYIRNEANLGFSANVANLYKAVDTSYVWFLCDDDSIYLDSVNKVIGSISRLKPTVGIFNCSWQDSYGVDRIAGVKNTIEHINFETFSNYDVLMRTSFLSILVFRKIDGVIERITENIEFKENVFVQITLALQLLSKKFHIAEINELILHRNVGFKYGEFYKFAFLDPLKSVYQLQSIFSFEKFKKWAIQSIPYCLLLFSSQKIGLFRYEGRITWESENRLREYYGAYSSAIKAAIFLIGKTPDCLFRYSYFLVLLFKYRHFSIAHQQYKKLVDRANHDNRDTGFTSYK